MPDFKEILKNIPQNPGVYQYFDSAGKILYVGKAKNLKKRVSSYFSKDHSDSAKTRILVRKIADIRYIIVDSEQDALLLENNLIKKYQPRYNVMLKDDKTYPWICIKNERFPRVFTTRTMIKDGSQYFGPYTSVFMLRTLLDLVRQLFKLRNCNLNLSKENIDTGKFKACLEYHIGNCNAPCINNETETDYNLSIENIKKILKGNISDVQKYLRELMQEYSGKFMFEEAQKVKDKIEIIEKYQGKSTVVSQSIDNVDVFAILDDVNSAYVNYFKIVSGAIIQTHTVELKKKLDETKEELLLYAIIDIRNKLSSNSEEIILPFQPDYEIKGIKITVPQIGDKKKLLELAERNLMYFKQEKIKKSLTSKNENKISVLDILMKDLYMNQKPEHIECFDISNLQGKQIVASCVVFRHGKPSNQEYRHFNIKSTETQDDFASMKEVVFRRFKRLLEENKEIPQLVVIDGGKGQLNASVESLRKLGIYEKMTVIGIAKKLEEIFFYGDKYPIYINKSSSSLRLLQHIRNEAHRFVIGFHRDKRSGEFTKSILESISGVGEKTILKLYEKFKTIDNIKNATIEQIAEITGKSKAGHILSELKKLLDN